MVEALNPFKAVRFARDMWDNGRRASKESGVSLFRIGIEQVALYVLNQLHRREYYMYALHDPALSWEEKRAFIGDRGASRYIDVLTPRRYACLFRNKLVFHRYARSAGLPLAVLYGLFDPKTGATREGRPLRSPDDLRVWIEASDVKDFVIKPVESSQGSMVMPLTADGDAFVSAGGERYSCEDLVHYMTDIESLQEAYPDTPNPPRTFLFEERLRPHPELRDFAEHTLCSTRVMTLSKCDGDIEVLAAAFKLPGEDRGVDNISRGGLCIAVNLDSGALREGVVHKSVPPTRYRKHPVTGKTFYGFELPLW
ncbi:MAG: sugar-transfer associated ATP-grasp domain-containing protein [Candidatus Brocadiia bacterium]